MIDSHCHLDLDKYEEDRLSVIDRAKQGGISAIINPGADYIGFEKPIKIAEQFDNVFAALGVHPEGVKDIDNDFWNKFASLLSHPKVKAIGEVGLERNERLPILEEQISILQKFIALAEQNKKPVIFHVRYVHQEFQKLLNEWNPKIDAVMHSFTGNLDDADFYLSKGFYLGIAGMITFPKADDLRAVVKEIPLNRMLIETDSPFLAPQVVRGQRNEPAYVVEVAKKIAEIKGISLEEVDKVTEANTKRLFGI